MTLQELEAQPVFADLSYRDQLQLRSLWAAKNINPDDYRLKNLSPPEKKVVLDSIIYRPPIMQDKAMEKMTAQVGFGFENSPDIRTKTLLTSAVQTFADQSLLLKGGTKMLDMFGYKDMWQILYSKDAAKMREYYGSLLSNDRRTAVLSGVTNVVAGLAGMGADMAAMYGMFAGSIQAPKFLAKMAQTAIDSRFASIVMKTPEAVRSVMALPEMTRRTIMMAKSPKFANWVAKSAAPSISHALLGGGLVGAIREPLMRVLDETQKKPTFGEMAIKVAEGFGGYALGDLMFFAIGSPIKSMAKATAKIFRKGAPPQYLLGTNINQKEFENLLVATASGAAVNDALLAQLPPQVRKQILYGRDLFKLTRGLSEVPHGSDMETRMMAATRGWMAGKRPDGKWTIEPFMGEGQFIEFGNTTQLKSWLAVQLVTPEFTATASTVSQREYLKSTYEASIKKIDVPDEVIMFRPGYYVQDNKLMKKSTFDALNPRQQKVAEWLGANVAGSRRKKFFIPASINGANAGASDLLHARAIYEKWLVDPAISAAERVGTTYNDVLQMTTVLREEGFFRGNGVIIQGVEKSEAWWNYVFDGPMLDKLRGYLNPNAINGMWDDMSRASRFTPAGARLAKGTVVDSAAEVLDEVSKPEKIPVSQRALITPEEADELIAYGVAKKYRRSLLSQSDLSEIAAGRMPPRHPDDTYVVGENTAMTGGQPMLVILKNPIDEAGWQKNLGHPNPSPIDIEIAREKAIADGFDGVVANSGDVVAFWPDQVKYISSAIDPYSVPKKFFTVSSNTADQAAVGGALNKYKISLMVKGQIKVDPDNLSQAIATLLIPRDGKVTKERLQQALKYYLKGNGIDSTNVFLKQVTMSSDVGRTQGHGWMAGRIGQTSSEMNVGLPDLTLINDPQRAMSFITTVLHEFQHVAQQIVPSNHPLANLTGATAFEIDAQRTAMAQIKILAQKQLWTPGWADMSVKKQSGELSAVQKVTGGYALSRQGGKTTVFNTFEEVIQDVLLHDLSDFQTIHNVVRAKGLVLYDTVRPDKTHIYQVRKRVGEGMRVLTEDTDLRRLLDKIGFTIEPSTFLMPELVAVDDAMNGLEFVKNVAMGDYQSAIRHLGGYRAKARAFERVKVLKLDKDGANITFDTATTWYRVEIPEAQIVKDFQNIEDAAAWMKSGWQTTDELKKLALQKGYLMRISNGGWHLWNKENAYFAKDIDELKKLFGTIKVPADAPEMLGEYRIAEKYGKPPDGSFRPEWFDPSQKGEGPHPLLQISQWARPADAYFVSWVKTGASADGLKFFRAMETGRRAAAGDMYATHKALWTLFSDPGNPKALMSKERRQAIFYYMDAPSEFGGKDKIVKQWKMSGEEVHRAELLRKFYDQIFIKFGVPSEMYLPEYISHLRKLPPSELAKLSRQTMADILKRSGAPRQFDEFFKHWRVEDMPNFVMDDDAFSVALKYSSVGHRALYLNPTLDELTTFLRDGKKNGVPVAYLHRLEEYRDAVVGLHSANEEAIHRALVDFGKKVGMKDPQGLKQLYGAWYSSGYLAMMGWRPYSAVRNLFQIWTTLAPRFGNANVARGTEYFLKNEKYIFETLKTQGHIMETLPLFGGEVMGTEGVIAKITHSGLKWFKNADDITRGIAWATAKVQWDDSLKNYQKLLSQGVDKRAAGMTFIELSGMSLIEPDIAKTATQFITEGKWAAGFDVFANNVITTSMFGYQAGLAPTSFKGLIGKMFGMFGVYPAWYVEAARRGLRYGSPAQKAAFAARFVGNSLSLFGAFAAVGINAKDFLPWVPAQFTGGPYYKLANKLLLSIGNDYAARQARGELKKELPRTLIPGSMAFTNFTKALKAAEAGDFHETWLHLTSAPHKENE